MNLSDLEARITRLEDIEAIKYLKAEYCDICDDLHNPDRITSLFVEDGIWEADSPGYVKAQGHKEIREAFQYLHENYSFSQHNIMNPRIDIDGNRAKGIWYLMGPWNAIGDGKRVWITARYEDTYIKVNGAWKYQHLKVSVRFMQDR